MRSGQICIIIPNISNTLVDRIGLQPIGGAWLQDAGRVGIQIEPAVVIVRAEDHWHAVVDIGHQFVRLGRHDGEAGDVVPSGPKAGECKEPAFLQADQVRLLLLAFALPNSKKPSAGTRQRRRLKASRKAGLPAAVSERALNVL